MMILIIVLAAYIIGSILTALILHKDLELGALIFLSLFSWIALLFIGIGLLVYWYDRR